VSTTKLQFGESLLIGAKVKELAAIRGGFYFSLVNELLK
jgi:hypothetical protein